MKVLLIDDQKSVRENLHLLLKTLAPELEVVGQAEGVRSGLEAIRKHQPDLIFLDIEMADGTGFDLLNLIPEPDFKVIFVTGHDGYAIRAFRVSAIDYLLKPIDPDDLLDAVSRAKSHTHIQKLQVKKALESSSIKTVKQLLLSDTDNVYLVSVDEIMHCQAEDNYTHFHLADGRKLLISKTLKEYSELLDSQNFFRTHQSHLVNLNYISHLDKRAGGVIVLKDGSSVPVAIRKKDSLLQRLKSLS
ncbi:LytR/AlgR family response regulator transcription factor [Algoriphagus namhaensis]